jgi:phage/plasmid-like protein (TIGR03299 family)
MPAAVETMAYVGETPWHGLGVNVESAKTPVEFMDVAGLNWSVDKRKIRVVDGPIIPGRFALTRSTDKRVLGTCGTGYVPVQNAEVFDFFDRFTRAGGMTIETAGSLHDGQKIWCLAKLPAGFELTGGDEIRPYLLLMSPHQAGYALQAKFTTVRVVCQNTLTQALRERGKATNFRHLHNRAFDADEATTALGLGLELTKAFEEKARFLASTPISGADLLFYMTELWPAAEAEMSLTAKRAMDAILTQPGAAMSEGTWWSVVNTVTYLTNHELAKTQDARLDSAWFGRNSHLNERALDLAIEYATNGTPAARAA